jgi:hypothetical protein
MTSIQILKKHAWRWAGKSPGGNSSSNIFRHRKLPGWEVWLPWVGQGPWQCTRRTKTGLEVLASNHTHDLDTFLSEITPKEETPR